MVNFRILIFLLVAVVLINFANAATIYGAVYDLSLKKVNNARVEINTLPKQFVVAQNGSYAFNVPNGFYTIKAQLTQKNTVIASVQENITIKQDGSYVLDLILFPDVEEGIEDIDIDVNGDIIETDKSKYKISVGTIVLFALGFILIGWHYFKKRAMQKKEQIKIEEEKIEEKYEGNDLEQLIKIIKKEGGRTTQKDIRKQIPLSEAKISLMIAELEHKGVIEKIKKGRGNIIILKKR
ncbi:hypothetical protein J4234_00680 [Candidatus Woesearchaeota archaeon]|nr:hypothetical protein [Candidatus Woesearchaeota archaeon]